MDIIVVIPARMASTRCPGKPLAILNGKPMVQWVFEAASKASLPTAVLIATPDEEICAAAKRFGAEAILTRHDHPTGTDRIAEVASMTAGDVFVNVQGDEPFIEPEAIDACIGPVARGSSAMASVYDWASPEDDENPNVVKVVTDLEDRALYFSRSPIPFVRGSALRKKKHVGLYAYTKEVLLAFSTWSPTPLEQAEVLEQLRFMENGVGIQMSYAPGTPLAVDTPEQAAEASRLLAARGAV
jgi:3-deoxy-manno-octulosonate cytidylyltransferase (CMP-KDO synthetase)